MAGQKRTRSGDLKPQSKLQPQQPQDIPMTDTPPCGQAQPSSRGTDTDATTNTKTQTKASRTKAAPYNTPNPRTHSVTTAPRTNVSREGLGNKNAAAKRTYNERKNKRPRLPDNATISKRPLLHPAIPTPFASAESPKVLYITASSPFIPTCKRIRSLLVQIQKRAAQSAGEGRGRGAARGSKSRGRQPEANGRLEAKDVEASVAEAAGKSKGKSVAGEEVYLKATGRAIPRALELGVKFQGEDGWRVRLEMGSVKAIDDVDMKPSLDAEGEGNEEEEVPETRIRTLSTVTVCIGLA